MNFFSPQWMLLTGIALSFFVQKDELQLRIKKISTLTLQLSVVLLGASLNFHAVVNQGISNVVITFVSIVCVFGTAYLLNKLFKIEKKQSQLITMGTAICGGSAIGALAPVIHADNLAITVSIGIVFLLNAVAIYVFPLVGDILNLSQDQFGMWAALAIHDTSSVVGAAGIFGAQALQVATTMKLIRALWIIPITLAFSRKFTFPWFILGFVLVSIFFTFSSVPVIVGQQVGMLAKHGFSLTLFLIGLTFSPAKIRQVGTKPLLFGFVLWILVSSVTLLWLLTSAPL